MLGTAAAETLRMQSRKLSCLVAVLCLAACGDDEPSSVSSPDASLDAALDAARRDGAAPDAARPDAALACERGKVWKATSTHLELTAFDYWRGSTGYSIDRADLDALQLWQLDALCVIQSTGPNREDTLGIALTIRDADGSVAEYVALEDDSGATEGTQVAIGPLLEFTQPLWCLRASEPRNAPTPFIDAGAATTPLLTDDPHCLNGAFVTPCSESWFRFNTEHSGTHTVRGGKFFGSERCAAGAQLELWDRAGNRLATSPSEGDAASGCATLTYSFDGADEYYFRFSTQNPGGCGASQGTSGDVILRVSRP
jgi:hypothetical protein